MAILKDYRLKGIYNFFVSYIFKYLKKNKYKHAVAHVHPKNKKSLDLVLNLGFRIIKKEKYLKSVRLFLIKDI